jgi:hypothetical protein
MSRLIAVCFFLSSLLLTAPLEAQVVASAERPLFLSGYATASGAEHELGFGHALGGGGGFIVEHSPWLALDVRGEILRARVPLHTYIAEAGPRVTRRYGRFEPYGEGMAGIGHSGYLTTPKRTLSSAWGWTWTVDAGLDFRVSHHLLWRVGEYSYNHTYAGTGAKAAILNTGVVYRF